MSFTRFFPPNRLATRAEGANPRALLSIVSCVLLGVAACASQAPNLSVFYGKVLRAEAGPGATLLGVEKRDRVIAEWVERTGPPDYLIVSSGRRVRLLYVDDDRVVVFTRQDENGELQTNRHVELRIPDKYSEQFEKRHRERLAELRTPPSEEEQAEQLIAVIEPRHQPKPKARPRPIEYSVETVEDISVLKATRFRYKVRVPRILSEKEIRSLSTDIIEQAPPHNGMDIYFYLPDSTLETGFTAGKAEWWPNGVAGDAEKVSTGDYSSHELIVTSGNSWGVPLPEPKLSAPIPPDMRRAIYFELVALEDRSVPHSEAAQRLAEHHSVTKAAIDEIAREGMARGWPMPPEPD